MFTVRWCFIMKLLIAIINDPEFLPDIFEEFYKVSINGATVIDSIGMGHFMATQISFFSRFAEFNKEPGHNNTLFVVVKSDTETQKAINAIEKVIGDLGKSDSGVVFTLPIDFCKGLNNDLGG